MNDNEIKNKFELSMKEAREGNKKFHWNMAIFAGASLTLLLSFIDKSKPIIDCFTKSLLTWSIMSLLISLISSPLVNFLSDQITSYFAQSERVWVSDNKIAIKFHNNAAYLTKTRAVLIYSSMFCALAGLLFLVIAIYRVYLK